MMVYLARVLLLLMILRRFFHPKRGWTWSGVSALLANLLFMSQPAQEETEIISGA